MAHSPTERKHGTTIADTYAADITARLTSISASLRHQVDASTHNVASMERSSTAIRSLSSHYREFANVSQQSKRLVRRHAERRRRDVRAMRAAVGVFLVVCLYVFVRRLPLIGRIMRLLLRVLGLVARGRTGDAGGVAHDQGL